MISNPWCSDFVEIVSAVFSSNCTPTSSIQIPIMVLQTWVSQIFYIREPIYILSFICSFLRRFLLDIVLMLLGEILSWSLMRRKRARKV